MPSFFLMIRRPPRSTLFPTRRSSDLVALRSRHPKPERHGRRQERWPHPCRHTTDRKSTRLNSSHSQISDALFFFNDTATTEIYTFPYTTLFRSCCITISTPEA